MTSIIKPEEYPDSDFVPITKRFYGQYAYSADFEIDAGPLINELHGLRITNHNFNHCDVKHVQALLDTKKIIEWLNENFNGEDYKVQRTSGQWSRWNLVSPPKLVVFTRTADQLRRIIDQCELPLVRIRAPVNNSHLDQVDRNTGIDTVDLRTQYYWGQYNVKINHQNRLLTFAGSRELNDLFGDLSEITKSFRHVGNTVYAKISDEDWSQLAFIKMTYGNVIEKITKVVLIES